RGLVTRPGLAEVLAYRRAIDARMLAVLDRVDADLLALGLAHEEQHQELLLMDVKHLLSCNPLSPAYAPATHRAPGATAIPLTWSGHAGGLVEIGAAAGAFAFDNETPRHRVWL